MQRYHQLSLTAFRLPLPGFRDVFLGTESLGSSPFASSISHFLNFKLLVE
jgi:hypothetical protein